MELAVERIRFVGPNGKLLRGVMTDKARMPSPHLIGAGFPQPVPPSTCGSEVARDVRETGDRRR